MPLQPSPAHTACRTRPPPLRVARKDANLYSWLCLSAGVTAGCMRKTLSKPELSHHTRARARTLGATLRCLHATLCTAPPPHPPVPTAMLDRPAARRVDTRAALGPLVFSIAAHPIRGNPYPNQPI